MDKIFRTDLNLIIPQKLQKMTKPKKNMYT